VDIMLIFLAQKLRIAYSLSVFKFFMSVHAHRKGKESNDSLFHRWKKQVQQTGNMKLLRERSHFKKKPNQRLQRQRALKREENRESNKKKQFYSNM